MFVHEAKERGLGRKVDGAAGRGLRTREGWGAGDGAVWGEQVERVLRPTSLVCAAVGLYLPLRNCTKSVWKEGAKMTFCSGTFLFQLLEASY